jgi:hypothetical protein
MRSTLLTLKIQPFSQRRMLMVFSKEPLIAPELILMPVPKQRTHIDSELFWCDPIVEFDENGDESVIHKEVTWN